MLQKWDLVTAAFNNGFSHKDKTFPEVPTDKHLGKDVVKHKFEDLTADVRKICMAEDPTKIASMINQKTYEGFKLERDVAGIENEIKIEWNCKQSYTTAVLLCCHPLLYMDTSQAQNHDPRHCQ